MPTQQTLFPAAPSRRGAPMGRAGYTTYAPIAPRSLGLQRVHIDAGGYDPGGAYWGLGEPLWCLYDLETEGGQVYRFTRAPSRLEAWRAFNLDPDTLLRPPAGVPRLTRHQRDALHHLRASWGMEWQSFGHDRKAHEWRSLAARRAATGQPDPGANPFEHPGEGDAQCPHCGRKTERVDGFAVLCEQCAEAKGEVWG